MKNITRVATATIIMASVGLCLDSSRPAAAEDATVKFNPCYIAGVKDRLRCTDIDLPLDYTNPGGERISVHVTIVPAKASTPAPDPFLVFAGGPGQAAGDYGLLVRAAFDPIHAKRDIILIDQRGTGQSAGLKCGGDEIPYPLDRFTATTKFCFDQAPKLARQITMENTVRDTDEIRAKLGIEKLNLWGGSYGTRTVALYLKRCPKHVRSLIVDGVLPPDVSLFETAGQSAERAKHLIAEDCAASPACNSRFPDFEAQIDALLDKAKAGDLRYQGPDPVSGEMQDIEFGFGMMVEALRASFYGADSTVFLPLVVDDASKGNLRPLVAAMSNGAGVSDSMYLGNTLSILCGDEIGRVDDASAQRAGEGSFAADSYYRFWKAGCMGWQASPAAPDAFEPARGDVPALVLSGNLDPITPPTMGDHFVAGFPNGRHLVVGGTGHNTGYVGCMPRLMADFVDDLDASALDASCLDHLKRLPIVTGINGNVN